MTKEEILSACDNYDRVKDFLGDLIGDHIIYWDIENWNPGEEIISITTHGRCGDDYYTDFNLDELLKKGLEPNGD